MLLLNHHAGQDDGPDLGEVDLSSRIEANAKRAVAAMGAQCVATSEAGNLQVCGVSCDCSLCALSHMDHNELYVSVGVVCPHKLRTQFRLP